MVPSARVGDLAEQVRGVTYGKDDASSTPAAGYLPVLRAGNITDTGLVFDDLVYVPAAKVSARQKIRRGDIVIAASSGSLDVVGKAAPALAAFDGGFGAFCKVIRPNDKVDAGYLAQFFKTPSYRRTISSLAAGANINNLKSEHLDDLLLPLPPLPEQRRISAILDQADALSAKRREALAQLDSLTQSIFIAMFGEPATNPIGWPTSMLKTLGKVTTGGTPPGGQDGMFDGPIPFLTPGDLESDAKPKRTVTNAGAAAAVTVRAGATLVCCIGATIGKTDIARVRSAFNQQLNAVDWRPSVNDVYGLVATRSLKAVIVARGASTTLPILKKSAFEELAIAVPPLALQQTFATRIQAVESLKATHRAALAELGALFASLQHRAFSGGL